MEYKKIIAYYSEREQFTPRYDFLDQESRFKARYGGNHPEGKLSQVVILFSTMRRHRVRVTEHPLKQWNLRFEARYVAGNQWETSRGIT